MGSVEVLCHGDRVPPGKDIGPVEVSWDGNRVLRKQVVKMQSECSFVTRWVILAAPHNIHGIKFDKHSWKFLKVYSEFLGFIPSGPSVCLPFVPLMPCTLFTLWPLCTLLPSQPMYPLHHLKPLYCGPWTSRSCRLYLLTLFAYWKLIGSPHLIWTPQFHLVTLL